MNILEGSMVYVCAQALSFIIAFKVHYHYKKKRLDKLAAQQPTWYREFLFKYNIDLLKDEAWLGICLFFPGSALFLLIHDILTNKE